MLDKVTYRLKYEVMHYDNYSIQILLSIPIYLQFWVGSCATKPKYYHIEELNIIVENCCERLQRSENIQLCNRWKDNVYSLLELGHYCWRKMNSFEYSLSKTDQRLERLQHTITSTTKSKAALAMSTALKSETAISSRPETLFWETTRSTVFQVNCDVVK